MPVESAFVTMVWCGVESAFVTMVLTGLDARRPGKWGAAARTHPDLPDEPDIVPLVPRQAEFCHEEKHQREREYSQDGGRWNWRRILNPECDPTPPVDAAPDATVHGSEGGWRHGLRLVDGGAHHLPRSVVRHPRPRCSTSAHKNKTFP